MEPADGDSFADGSPETRKIFKRASQIFVESQPYTRLLRKGSIFTPVEAGYNEADTDGDDGAEAERIEMASIPEDDKQLHGSNSVLPASGEAETFTYGTIHKGTKQLILHVQVLSDSYSNPKHCLPNGDLKPRRPVPHIRASQLIEGLTNVNGEWVFQGELNGWPAYRNYALKSLTSLTDYKIMKKVNRLWKAEDGKALPKAKDLPAETRATFMAPSWASIGWAPSSPGFVFWYSKEHGEPRCLVGEGMVQTMEADKDSKAVVTNAHMFAHRYPSAKESLEDRNTWHIGCFLEWSHGKFGTIVELAWRNGCGGYGGRANWIPDKLEPETELFKCMPYGQKQPWDSKLTEIRMYDLDCKTKADFEAHLLELSEKKQPLAQQRFLEPRIVHSAPIRLRRLTAPSLAEYILNYAHRAAEYSKLTCNCQTLGADLFAFITGSKDIVPFHALQKAGYKQRTRAFIYVPHYDDDA